MTDDFTTAARVEANSRTEQWGDERNRRRFLSIFTSGAEWARDHLPEEMREKLAVAHQERNKALERARKAEELLRNVGDHPAAQEPTDAELHAAILAFDGLSEHYAPGDAMRAALTAARAVGRDAR